MKPLRKYGGLAALYLAVAYLIGMVIFLVVLDYPSISDPAQKVALLVEMPAVTFVTNLLMYVFFGVGLIVLALALYQRLQAGAPALMQVATAIGIIWAGSLIASGMVANAGIAPAVALRPRPGAGRAGLAGHRNGGQRAGQRQRRDPGRPVGAAGQPGRAADGWTAQGLNILGLLVGAVGIVSLIPGLTDLVGAFGLGQVIWFVWLAIVLLRSKGDQ